MSEKKAFNKYKVGCAVHGRYWDEKCQHKDNIHKGKPKSCSAEFCPTFNKEEEAEDSVNGQSKVSASKENKITNRKAFKVKEDK